MSSRWLQGTATGAPLGVFAGVEYQATDGSVVFSKVWTADTVTLGSANAKAYVYSDPDIVYEAQSTGTPTQASIGTTNTISTTAGDSNTGRSKEGVTTTASGLQYEVLTNGTGSTPVETDQVTVHYHGTLVDGTVFDSSVERGQPATFPVNGVIKGWVEALQLMNVGSKYKLYIPSDLAYGERGAGGSIGPNETLIFEVELLSIN